MVLQARRASRLPLGFGARAAVYCVAALLFVVSVQSVSNSYSTLDHNDLTLTGWQILRLMALPGLMGVIAVGLLLKKPWAWALAIAVSLISGIAGLIVLGFRLDQWPWVEALSTRGRAARWGVSAVADLGIVVVLLIKPVRKLFFRGSQPPTEL